MPDRETLYAKSKFSCVIVGMPVGSHEHHGFCVLPTDERYFTSDEEVEEYEQLVVSDYMASGAAAFSV